MPHTCLKVIFSLKRIRNPCSVTLFDLQMEQWWDVWNIFRHAGAEFFTYLSSVNWIGIIPNNTEILLEYYTWKNRRINYRLWYSDYRQIDISKTYIFSNTENRASVGKFYFKKMKTTKRRIYEKTKHFALEVILSYFIFSLTRDKSKRRDFYFIE